MVHQANFFALLVDEEGDDVSKLLERVAAKVEASSRTPTAEKKMQPQSKIPPSADSVIPDKGRGRGGQDRSSGRNRGNDAEQFGNSHPNGYQENERNDGFHQYNELADSCRRNNGQGDGYRRDYRQGGGYGPDNWQSNGYRRDNNHPDVYQQDNGRTDGYRRDNGWADNYHRDNGRFDGNRRDYADTYQQNNGGNLSGYALDGNRQGQGRGVGRGGDRAADRGRGRGFNGDRRFGNGAKIVDGNQQLESQGKEGNAGGSPDKMTEGHSHRDERQLRHRNQSYGGERTGYDGGNRGLKSREARSFGGREGRNNGKGEVKSSDTKEDVDNAKLTMKVDNSSAGAEGNNSVTTEVSKSAEREQRKRGQGFNNHSDFKAKEEEEAEENNKMTLEEYEKQLIERRKVLGALKSEERKVTLDKDFESMQIVEKKKEGNIFIKLNSENDKLKKKDSVDKDEKVCKSVSINEFLKQAEGERRGGRGGGGRGGYSKRWVEMKEEPAPAIEDPVQFPVLGGAIKQGSN